MLLVSGFSNILAVGSKKLSKSDMAKATVKLINRGLGTFLLC